MVVSASTVALFETGDVEPESCMAVPGGCYLLPRPHRNNIYNLEISSTLEISQIRGLCMHAVGSNRAKRVSFYTVCVAPNVLSTDGALVHHLTQ